MKTVIIIAATIFFLLIIQVIMAITILKTEQQKYRVISKDGKFEIRKYFPAILASVKMKGSYDNMSTQGFRTLANYIFSGNEQNMKIKMTAPVRMQVGDSTTMSFVMPSKFNHIDQLPRPKNTNIYFNNTHEVMTASLRFGGYANDKRIAKKIEALKAILQDKNIEHENDFQFLGYNPPFQVIGRKNEILVGIELNTN